MASFGTTLGSLGLWGYGLLMRAGLMQTPLVRAMFVPLYRAYKTFETGPIHRLSAYVRPGDAVIDVGANIGVMTKRFAEWVGATGKVIAVEPEDVNFATLKKEMDGIGLAGRVEMVPAVCADAPGQLHLDRNETHPGDHKIALDGQGPVIEATTIDLLAERVGSRPITLIKIDVQGAEMMVLSGATDTLSRHAPALIIEIDEKGLARFGATPERIIALLSGHGYEMHRLTSRGAAPLSRAGLQEALKANPYTDVLFLHPGSQ